MATEPDEITVIGNLLCSHCNASF